MAALNASVVPAASGAPARYVAFLHGIFGSGGNWRSFAKKWVESKPGWAALLVDLRMHGQSLGLPPPHTVQAAAADLVSLARTLDAPIDAIVGHSFGGKVALAYVDAVRGELEKAFILDSTPGARPDQRGSEIIYDVLAFLQRVGPVPTRAEFTARAQQELGFSLGMAQWLAMNLEKRGESFEVKLDLDALRALLEDYFRLDLWEVLERPPGRVKLEVILGGDSRVFDDAERARLRDVAARLPARVSMHEIAGAGHWLHVDDPEATLKLLLA